jgi:hypothetical protein
VSISSERDCFNIVRKCSGIFVRGRRARVEVVVIYVIFASSHSCDTRRSVGVMAVCSQESRLFYNSADFSDTGAKTVKQSKKCLSNYRLPVLAVIMMCCMKDKHG